MSSALTLIVLGQAIVIISSLAHISLAARASSFRIPASDNTLIQPLPNCPLGRADYTYIPGVGSHKVHPVAATWEEAREICQEEGGDLAVINSKVESIIVGQLLVASWPHENTKYSDFGFIGFGDTEEEGQYVTVHGESLSEAGFEEWFPGEPNDGGAHWRSDDCGSIHISGQLNDASCRLRYAFVCELPNPAQVDVVEPINGLQCFPAVRGTLFDSALVHFQYPVFSTDPPRTVAVFVKTFTKANEYGMKRL